MCVAPKKGIAFFPQPRRGIFSPSYSARLEFAKALALEGLLK